MEDEKVIESSEAEESTSEITDQEKIDRFKEETKDRMAKICQQIDFLEKIAGKRTVSYTKENVDKMFSYLEGRLASCKETYMERFEESKKDFDFDF